MTTVDIRLNRGFSLVELLIAMALGLMLTLGVLDVFLATKESFVLQQRSAAMQENARFLLSRMAQDIRQAGQLGCLDLRRLPAAQRAAVPPQVSVPVAYQGGVLRLVSAQPLLAATATGQQVSADSFGARWLLVSNCLNRAQVLEADTPVTVGPDDMLIPLRLLEYRQQGQRIQVRSNGRGNFETLIEGVASFELSFRMAAQAPDVGAYASSVAAADAERIRSVRLAMVLSERPGEANQRGLQAQRYVQVTAIRNRIE